MDNNRPLFDRRTLLAMAMVMGVVWIWSFFAGGKQPVTDGDTDAPVVAAPPPAPAVAPPPVSSGPLRQIPFEACNTAALVSTDGGGIGAIELRDYKADYHVTPIWTWALHLVTGPRVSWVPYDLDVGPVEMVTPKGAFFEAGSGELAQASTRMDVVTETKTKIELRGVSPDGVTITRTYETRPDCAVDVVTTWSNPASSGKTATAWIGVHDVLSGTVSRSGRSAPRPVAVLAKRQAWDIPAGPPAEAGGPVKVLGLEDHYFAVVGATNDEPDGVLFTNERKVGDTVLNGVSVVWPAAIEAGKTWTRHHVLYLGPQSSTPMAAVHPELPNVIDQGWFGWFAFFGTPLLWVLRLFHGWTGSWGVSIILLTFVFKTLFYPLTASAFRSGLKMQAIQPQLAAIREEYRDNPEELNRRTVAMFSQHGVNPVGGCLPMFAQMPVWIALTSVLTFSVELYHSSFFLWKDLAAVDPYAILPVCVVALQLALQRLMPTAPGMDPAQARMMQYMPVILAFLYFNLPAGLMIYIFVNLLLTIVQQLLMKRLYHPPVLPA